MVDFCGCIVCQCLSIGINKLREILGKCRYLVDYYRFIGKYILSMRSLYINFVFVRYEIILDWK